MQARPPSSICSPASTKPNEGSWTFDGHQLAGVRPHKVAKYGMVRTFQLTKALSRLTVMENMPWAPRTNGRKPVRLDLPLPLAWSQNEITEQALQLLDSFNLAAKQDELAGSLSGGQRKLLEMARALMVRPT